MQFSWRWNGGTIPLNLGVIWEMSDERSNLGHARADLKDNGAGRVYKYSTVVNTKS
jgi:hypothetical protein